MCYPVAGGAGVAKRTTEAKEHFRSDFSSIIRMLRPKDFGVSRLGDIELVAISPDKVDLSVVIDLPPKWPGRLELCGWVMYSGGPLPYFRIDPVKLSKPGRFEISLRYGYALAPHFCVSTKLRLCICWNGLPLFCREYAFTRCWATVYPPRDVWVCPNIDVYLDWDAAETDHEVQDIVFILNGMNELLYGALDGQVRIGQFTMYDDSTRPATDAKGSFHFHDKWDHGTDIVGMASGLGTLVDPSYIHLGRLLIQTHGGSEPHDHYSFTALMEFCHAYFGALDEYISGDGGRSHCPDNTEVACPLEHNIGDLTRADPDMTKFCGPSAWGAYAHFEGNPVNAQEAVRSMSCYEWIAQEFQTHLNKTIVVPRSPLSARPVPPDPNWVFNL